jgi:dTDP-4-dehydrorhamnose reductase
LAYKILITGSEGQLGSILNIKLSKMFQVIATSTNKLGNNSLVTLDITKPNEVNLCINKYNPDIVINTAALTDVDFCEDNKSIARSVNVEGLKNLIKYTSKKTKIIHISTDYVYNGEQCFYTEESKPDPINYYGKTKLEADNFLIGSNKIYAIIRPNTIYHGSNINFFTWVYKNISNNNKIKVVNDQICNPSYIPSLVNSIIDIIIMNGLGLYQHGSKDSLSRYQFALRIAKKYKFSPDLIIESNTLNLNQSALRPMKSILNTDKIENDFDSQMLYVNNCIDNIYEIKQNG